METVDFLLTKAARLDKALKSLPKADRKTLHTSSHKRARKLLRNLSFPAQVSELTDENIENQIDVLTTVKSSVVSFAKKMPPLSDALTVGPDAMAVRACALEAREGLAEDLCSEEISKTGASLDHVDALSLLTDHRAKPWPDLKLFSEYYETPPHLRPPRRSLPCSESLPVLPMRPTIGGIEEATQVGRFPDLLPALLKSAAGTLPPDAASAEPRTTSKQNIFHATAVYRDACKRCKVQVLETLPILGEMVEVVAANLEETKHCYALAEAIRTCAVKGLKVEECYMPDMGAAKIIEAAFSGEHLETVALSGLTLSYRSVLALYTALRQKRLGNSLRHLTLAACGLGGDLELPPGAAAAYEKGRALLESHPVDEETLAKGGDVAGLLSEHLQESLRKAKLEERPALHMAATATSLGSDAADKDEVEMEEEEELPPPPVLLPVFHQLTHSRVVHLNLSQTWLSPSSLRALSNSLPQTQVEVIKLDECGLTDDAVEELALQGLLRSRLLLEVSLRRNQLSGNPGAISTLFHAVRIHARIAHLDLAENLMHPECVPELSKLLRHSVSLLCLHLLGCEDSQVEDTVAIQGACYRWVAQNAAAAEHMEIEEIDIPEPAQGEEHSEVILCRVPHLDVKDWQVAAPRPKPMRRHDEEATNPWAPKPPSPEKSKVTEGCWIKEAREANAKFQIPEGVSGPEQVTPEEIDDWCQGPARIQALSDCFEEDIKIIYLKDVCHVEDEGAVKEALRSKYDLYYECYALFAGRSQWPFVRYVDMFSVFEEARVVDRTGGRKRMEKRRLHMQDIHVMITQTLANHNGVDPVTAAPEAEGDRGPKKKTVPEGNPLTRPQFCEVMLRAAISWGDDLSASAAITLFADEIVAGHLLQPPLAPFPRGLAQRPGDYNDALQNSSRTLKEAWERFGYSSVAFQRLAQLVRLCDRSFTSKHVASIYTLAKVPVVDDRVSTAGDTRGLSYTEFLEAVGRLAMVWSRSSWMPACCPQEDGSMRGRRWPPQPQAGRPVKERILAQRLEGFVQRMAERMRPSVKGRLA